MISLTSSKHTFIKLYSNLDLIFPYLIILSYLLFLHCQNIKKNTRNIFISQFDGIEPWWKTLNWPLIRLFCDNKDVQLRKFVCAIPGLPDHHIIRLHLFQSSFHVVFCDFFFFFKLVSHIYYFVISSSSVSGVVNFLSTSDSLIRDVKKIPIVW